MNTENQPRSSLKRQMYGCKTLSSLPFLSHSLILAIFLFSSCYADVVAVASPLVVLLVAKLGGELQRTELTAIVDVPRLLEQE